MIEAFYSGTAGIEAHQNALDVVANNIANVNTTAYKSKDEDFGSLLAVSEVRPETANSANLLAGSGSDIDSVDTDMSSGAVDSTGNPTDFSINGGGFFAVRDNAGNTYYTRDGSFHLEPTAGGEELVTADGMAVLDAAGNPVTAASGGTASSPGVFTFSNAPGLLSDGGNLFTATAVSGTAQVTTEVPEQGMLEGSNVDLSQQMVDLITSQRGYQFNSNVVSTADQIESMVNSLGQD